MGDELGLGSMLSNDGGAEEGGSGQGSSAPRSLIGITCPRLHPFARAILPCVR